MYKAVWTGHYPTLCMGEWKLYKDGQEVKLPKNIRDTHMNTLGTYTMWSFDGYKEEWYENEEGLDFDKWVLTNKYWLQNICEPCDYKEVYEAFREQDWRYCSCGGCI